MLWQRCLSVCISAFQQLSLIIPAVNVVFQFNSQQKHVSDHKTINISVVKLLQYFCASDSFKDLATAEQEVGRFSKKHK